MTSETPHSNDNQPEKPTPQDNDPGPNMGTLLLVAAVLVGIAWVVATNLRHNGRIQDCVMQGRSNCAEIVR